MVTPARWAASTFSFTPPIGSTLPRSVISPVIATSRRAGMLRQRRDQRGGHRDAGRRAVLGNRALGHVDVHVELAVEVLRDAELLGARAHVAHRRLRRLLHHVAELAGERQAALPGISVASVTQDLAAHLGPGQAGGDADLVLLFGQARRGSAARRGTAVTLSAVISSNVPAPSATTLRATLRQTEAISRSRLRTPASRV